MKKIMLGAVLVLVGHRSSIAWQRESPVTGRRPPEAGAVQADDWFTRDFGQIGLRAIRQIQVSPISGHEPAQAPAQENGPSPIVNRCAKVNYVDRTGPDADRTIDFRGLSYSVPCMTIRAGQSVIWKGPFKSHPLRPGVAPSIASVALGTTPNPIMNTDSGVSATFTFLTEGLYPYNCEKHEIMGMYGTVHVVAQEQSGGMIIQEPSRVKARTEKRQLFPGPT